MLKNWKSFNILILLLGAELAFAGTGANQSEGPAIRAPFLDSHSTTSTSTSSYALPFTPYSSDYQNMSQAYLLEEIDSFGPLERFLSPALVGAGTTSRQSLLSKFDTVRESLIPGSRDSVAQAYQDQVDSHNQSAASMGMFGWTGVCNQWSAAAIDPVVASLLNNNIGIICDGVLFSRGGLKELLTSFYHYAGVRQSDMLGTKQTIRNLHPMEMDSLYEMGQLEEGGINPHEFSDYIESRLRRGRGVILDRDPGYQVWNHPVFGIETTSRQLSNDEVVASQYLGTQLPISHLESTNESGRQILETIARLDRYILSFVNQSMQTRYDGLEITDAMIAENNTTELQLMETINEQFSSHERVPARVASASEDYHQYLIHLRVRLRRELLNFAFERGNIRLPAGLTVELRSSHVDYGTEVAFRDGGDALVANDYQYLVFKQVGEVVGSSWITPPQERPDYVSSIDPLDLDPASAETSSDDDPRRTALRDLVQLMRSCTSLSDVMEFAQFLKEASSDNQIDADERAQIEEELPTFGEHLDPSLIRRFLAPNGTSLPGLEGLTLL